MNDILVHKWKQNKYPFNENVLTLTDYISLNDLSNALNIIYQILFFKFGNYKLYCIEDWHNHDGFIIKEKATTWEILKNITKDKDILFDSRYDDFEVYNLYYDENFNFLLRYNIEGENI